MLQSVVLPVHCFLLQAMIKSAAVTFQAFCTAGPVVDTENY